MPPEPAGQPTVHYGWIILLAGTLTVLSSLGLGRFALGMLLPSMGASIPLSYEQMGFIGTGNFVGYLIAVTTSSYLVRIIGSRFTISIGLFVTGATLVAVDSVEGYYPVLILYFLTGFCSGSANVPIIGLVSHWFYRNQRVDTGIQSANYSLPADHSRSAHRIGLHIHFSIWYMRLEYPLNHGCCSG